MKKALKPILITLLALGVLTGGAVFLLTGSNGTSDEFAGRIAGEQNDQGNNRAYRYDTDKGAVPLLTSGENKNVLNFDSKTPYQVSASNEARARLDRLIKRTKATLKTPIIAANPFGTNENTFYFYFETGYRSMIRYTVMVADESIYDHVRYANNGKEDNLSQVHEFVVGGLVPGMTNYIRIEALDSTGACRESETYKYDVPASQMPNHLTMEQGRSEELCENGLFFVFPEKDSRIYAYDNAGVLRDVVKTESSHGKRIYQSGDCVLYQVSDTKVARVSAIGRVTGTAQLSGYGKIRDFAYDGYEYIYCLGRKKKRDCLVAVSLQSGKSREVFSFPKGVSTVSLTAPEAGGLYLACQNPRGLVKLDALTGKKPFVSFILGRKNDWKKAGWKKKAAEDKTALRWDLAAATLNLVEGRPEGKAGISAYVADNGKGTGLSFAVDEKKKTVEVKNSFPVGKGGACGCQVFGRHFVISSLSGGNYEEYDREGNVTRQFSLGSPMTGVVKLSLNGMCFYGGE